MYISLGNGKFAANTDIIGIFDLDITSQSHLTRKYLNAAEKAGKVINASEDIPKSFLVTKEGNVYISQPATATLIRRIEDES